MWREFNNNPKGHRVGDCAVRAVSVALGVDWDTAYAMLANEVEQYVLPTPRPAYIVQNPNCCPNQFGCGAA